MTARRSSSDAISHYLKTGERVVWRHQPASKTLFYNRLPTLIIVLVMTAGLIAIGSNVVASALPGPGPVALDAWLILPAGALLFFLLLLYFFLGAAWNHFRFLLDSWSTHYALTDQRFLIVSSRGVIEYDAPDFHVMEARGGAPGGQVLLFDYGPSGKHKRDNFRDRIAGLPDSEQLEQLIRDTLRP